MTRNTRTLIVVGAAMASAGLASFGVYHTIQQMPVQKVQVVEREQIVASQPVPVGMILTFEMVKAIPWPANNAIPGGFSNPADVIGRGVTAALVENEPVSEAKLAPKGAGGGMVTTIPQGMRAMAVRVNDVIGVAGFALPGTRVDVVVTVKSDRESISRTVLSNIQVLTAGTNFDAEKSKNGAAIAAPVVTLLVTPSDAERLALATTQGQIVLALRNPLDTTQTESAGAHMANLLGSSAAPVATPARAGGPARVVVAPPPPPPTTQSIAVTRGTSTKQEIIKQEIIKR